MNSSEIKKLKICIISFDWRNIFQNDFEEFKRKLERDRLGLDVNDFFVFSWSNKAYYEKKENIETEHFEAKLKNFRPWYDILTIFLLPYALSQRNFRPDIVYVKEFPFIFACLIPRILWGTKIVFLLSATPASLVKTRRFGNIKLLYQRLCERFSKRYINIPLANGEATRDYLVKMGFKKEAVKIFTGNAVLRDIEYIEASKKGKIRKQYNIGDDKKIILSVGRLEKEKGYDRLLNLFAGLNRDDLVLIIAGDGILKKEIEKQIQDLNLENKVILAGWVSRKDIWNYYRDADIFTLLSYSDGCPTVVREAMYMGVPVIGSDIESIRAFLGENGERGLLWSEKEGVRDFDDKIKKCLNDKNVFIHEAKIYINKEMKDLIPINNYL